ncbi:MAG: radical SAM protein [bacterium]
MNTTAPIMQQQELTSKCNNNCSFCYNPERCAGGLFQPRKEDIEMNLEIAKISIGQGVMAICPTGGEPLLLRDHLFEILKIYKQAGCYTSINSNGRLITEEAAREFSLIGLNSALISIHGINELHNEMVGDKKAFFETWQGIINLRKAKINVIPNFVATAKNIHGLVEVGEALAKLNIL